MRGAGRSQLRLERLEEGEGRTAGIEAAPGEVLDAGRSVGDGIASRSSPAAWRAFADASTDQLRACERHADAAWAHLSPPALLEPDDTGNYRRGTTTLLVGPDGTSGSPPRTSQWPRLTSSSDPARIDHFTVNELALS